MDIRDWILLAGMVATAVSIVGFVWKTSRDQKEELIKVKDEITKNKDEITKNTDDKVEKLHTRISNLEDACNARYTPREVCTVLHNGLKEVVGEIYDDVKQMNSREH